MKNYSLLVLLSSQYFTWILSQEVLYCREAVVQRCSVKKVLLEIFAKFTGKHLSQIFFHKFAGLGPATLLKKRLWHSCFAVNFVKILRTPSLTEHRWQLFLIVICIVTPKYYLYSTYLRGVFRTRSNIHDRTFLRKYLIARNLTVF